MAKKPATQTQRMITALAASILVFYLWVFIYQRFLYTPPATQPAVATAPAGTPGPATEPTGTAAAPTAEAPETVTPSTRTTTGDGLTVTGGTQAAPVKVGDAGADSPFPMALELTPRGAAVQNAWIRGHFETVKKNEAYRVFQPLAADDQHPERYSLVTSKVRFVDLDRNVDLDSVVWQTDSVTNQEAVFSVQVNQPDGKALARVVKTYSLEPQPAQKRSGGQTYDLTLTTRIENLTGQPLRAVLVQQGPVGFQREQTRSEDRSIVGAIYEKDRGNGPVVKAHARTELAKKDLLELGRDESDTRIAWVAEANQYFTCIMAPAGRVGFEEAVRFERADAIHLSKAEDATSEDLTFRYVSAPVTVQPGGSRDITFDCYIGPKSKAVFTGVEKYEKRDYYAVIKSSFYACAPTALVSLMMWLLNQFYRIWPHNYGIAIFLLVVLVRTILHPITKRSQVNMMKMQKQMSSLTPKINAAKEKYANDKTAMNQAIMEVYRDAGVNPAGSVLTCIPMMLQLPIWAALWAALSSTVEMRHAPLDGWWIKDLTQPDMLVHFSDAGINIPLIGYIMGGPVHALNVLPILLAVSQLLQAKYMPRSTAPSTSDNPDQMEQQRKMMMFMSIFFLFMFYNMPSGLNLYIMTSNVGGIFEQWRIRKHIAEEEEKLKNLPPGVKPPQGPIGKFFEWVRSWLGGKWQELQKEAEEVKKLQSEKSKKRK